MKQKIIDDLPNLDIIFLANPNHFLDNLIEEDISQLCEIGKKNNVIVVAKITPKLNETAIGSINFA